MNFSLYPYAMTQDQPIGDAIFVESQNSTQFKDLFGFVEVKITIDNHIFRPPLPLRIPEIGQVNPTVSW